MEENIGGAVVTIVLVIFAVAVIVAIIRSVLQVHQGYTYIIERLGKYHKTLTPGLHFLVPFIDSVRQRIDMREDRKSVV